MAAEHEDRAVDALMAAITDQPLPPGDGPDPALPAEHRSATADVALLREQLKIIGNALADAAPGSAPEPAPAPKPAPAAAGPGPGPTALGAEPATATGPEPAPGPGTGPEPEPVPAPEAGPVAPDSGPRPAGSRPRPRSRPSPRPRPGSRRRPLAVALGAVAAVCAGTLVAGLGWLAAQGGGGASDAASDKAAVQDADGVAFGSPRHLACARLVAEGTVTGVEPLTGGERHRISLDVTRSYKPDPGKRRITFLLDDATARLHVGDRVLVGVPLGGDTADAVITGERAIAAERPWITASLPESRALTCD
ncbi:hypothetical protein ACLGIH_22680 [Streptomyces sp. HMX87]|uniref:hypothetical protein n=1 Tax=Streptomyces sp. HMX87 TaxID=3390849 RepID=UPI003A8879B4